MARVLRFLDEAKRWVRYAYFLRFSLALWLFAPLLCALNRTSARTLTSGVMTPETFQQYLCVAFFLLSASFVALVCARVVLINGPVRWDKCHNPGDDGRPNALKNLLANDEGRKEWWALFTSQLPNVVVYFYLVDNGNRQQVHRSDIWLGLIFGSVLAIGVWWMVNAWYYLTYDAPDPTGIVEFNRNAARTLLFPRTFPGFNLHRLGIDQYSHQTIEGASTWLRGRFIDQAFRAVANLFDASPGYAYHRARTLMAGETLDPIPPRARLYEGHVFSGISALVYVALYGLLWPLTAPVPALYTSITVLVLFLLVCAAFVWVILKTPNHPWWKAGLTTTLAVVFLSILAIYIFSSAERFPTLATLLIIATGLCWALSGVAFFLDHYRVPVMSVVLLVMIAPRLIPGHPAGEEHYLSTITFPHLQNTISAEEAAPEPRQLLARALAANPDDNGPLIIVTSNGGGLHASAWTAEVLAHLEAEFNRQYPAAKGTFHRHLLLASTVSGGSVGLLSYLRELRDPEPDFDRMRATAQCSSLEAVSWGFVYWDLSKALVPFLPYFWRPSPGDDDLDPTPLGKDRTWSLRKGFARNLNNDFCRETWRRDTNPHPLGLHDWLIKHLTNRLEINIHDEAGNQALARQLSLRNLRPAWDKDSVPAFTMNTTSDEDGQRFLLANYKIPDPEPNWPDTKPEYKARSFLATYSTTRISTPPTGPPVTALADLPLVTAAQMSGAFPYISSAARVPLSIDPADNAMHFVDGGYYDNDGTASVIEFLRYALATPSAPAKVSGQIPPTISSGINLCADKPSGATPQQSQCRPVRILLIEIRNTGDDLGSVPEWIPYHSQAKAPENLFTQLTAPFIGFWQAGHESDTARNRVGLAQLEHAFAGTLELHRLTFADNNSLHDVGTDPLSWSLTPRQRAEVRHSADASDLQQQYSDAVSWFRKSPEEWKQRNNADSNWPE